MGGGGWGYLYFFPMSRWCSWFLQITLSCSRTSAVTTQIAFNAYSRKMLTCRFQNYNTYLSCKAKWIKNTPCVRIFVCLSLSFFRVDFDKIKRMNIYHLRKFIPAPIDFDTKHAPYCPDVIGFPELIYLLPTSAIINI